MITKSDLTDLDELECQRLEREYINSYTYTTPQKLFGCVLAMVVILSVIGFGTVIFMNIIGWIFK